MEMIRDELRAMRAVLAGLQAQEPRPQEAAVGAPARIDVDEEGADGEPDPEASGKGVVSTEPVTSESTPKTSKLRELYCSGWTFVLL